MAIFGLLSCGPEPQTVPIHVFFKLLDNENNPIAGAPIRVLAGVPDWDGNDWRGPDSGVRIVTGADGTARFTTKGIVDRRWVWEPIGFTPLSMPIHSYHVGVGFEVAEILPSRHGDVVHHFVYTAEIDRFADGTSSTLDLDRLYEAGPDKRFTRLLGRAVTSPESVVMIDGIARSGAGYKLADFELDPVGDADSAKEWQLKLVLWQYPKPLLH